MFTRPISVYFEIVSVFDVNFVACVHIDNSLLWSGMRRMQVADIDGVGALEHSKITRYNATLAKSVVLEQGADGGSAVLAFAVKLNEIFVNGIQEGLPDMCRIRAEPEEMLRVTSGCRAAMVGAAVITDSPRVF